MCENTIWTASQKYAITSYILINRVFLLNYNKTEL